MKKLTLLCIFCVLFTNKIKAEGYAYAYGREDKNNMSIPVDGGIGLVLLTGVAMYSRKKIKK